MTAAPARMTRAEIRIAAAKKRVREAEAVLERIYDARRIAEFAVTSRYNPKVWAAAANVRLARVAVAVAELAALGITPMKTIVIVPATSRKVAARYVVKVTREGSKMLLLVGTRNRVMKGRTEQYAYDLGKVIVTDQEVAE